MKVSIIIPVYKVEKYIERCLQSINDQAYKDIECIIVNDCTPDNSFKMAQCYVNSCIQNKTAVEYKLVEHDHNLGLSEARNTGVRNSTGEYVFFLDSDDYIPSDSVSNLVKEAEKKNHPDIVYGHTVAITPRGEQHYIEPRQLPSLYNNRDILIGNLNNYWTRIACNKLVKRSLFTDDGKWFAPGLLHEDELWTFEISTVIESLVFCPNVTYYYCLHADKDSITLSPPSEKDFRDNISILERKIGYLGVVAESEAIAQNVYNLSYLFYLSLVRLKFPWKFRLECKRRLIKVIGAAKSYGNGQLHTKWYAKLAWMLF